jgi:hypothetical protein
VKHEKRMSYENIYINKIWVGKKIRVFKDVITFEGLVGAVFDTTDNLPAWLVKYQYTAAL